MIVLEMKTIFFINAVNNLVLLLVISFIYKENNKKFKGLKFWLYDYILQFIALVLSFSRVFLSPYVSVVLSNIMIISGILLLMYGMSIFIGSKPKPEGMYITIAVYSVLQYYFTIANPNVKARIILFSAVSSILLFKTFYILRFKPPMKLKPLTRNLSFVFLTFSMLYFSRLIHSLFIADTDTFFEITHYDTLFIVFSIMINTVVTFSLSLTINRRLIFELSTTSKDRERLLIKMSRLAVTDGLTGIFNRMKIEEVLNMEVLRAQRYSHDISVALLDIDFFKQVNDTYGHDAGDIVLKALAEILKLRIRETDTLGRWGGEEFLIVFPETSLEDCILIAEKLRTSVSNHEFEKIGHITISLGVSSLSKGQSYRTLIKQADDALYNAKNKGRNRVESI